MAEPQGPTLVQPKRIPRMAELHWYEAHGIGRKELKRKGYVD
jgi:hypothetical protein